ncbi:hypothetical protein [Streptomyces sp. x-80]|uniref:hypothetical protein n=1 Tax=Streptomyces sp. x-80 TaxID=2789282 RepID=UPI0039807398
MDAASRGTCRLPHPTVCPMVTHTDGDREPESVRRALAVRTRKAIDAKTFVPREFKPLDEDEVAEQHVTVADGAERHVVRHSTRLWLAPTTIQNLRCVARSGDDRCSKAVRAEDSPEGDWEEADTPLAPGRSGQQVLAAGSTMWVWVLNVLDYDSLNRWIKQRCPAHWKNSAPDAEAPEWVHFSALRHDAHILHQRPADLLPQQRPHPGPLEAAFGPKRTVCAGEHCHNGTVMPVSEGWLCYKCAPKIQRRAATHRKWQQDTGAD